MKNYIDKIALFFAKNLWITFLINAKALFDLFEWVINKILKTNITMEKIPFGYNEIILLITSIVMYSIFKILIRYINNISSQTTKNINDLSRILNNKIRYVDFKTEHQNLDNDSYIRKLHEWGFSSDDLEEIGVDYDFLKSNKNKLLPKNVIEKYTEFKNELQSYNNRAQKE